MYVVYYNQPLSDGKTTRIGVVIRKHEGCIIAMISGTMGHLNIRANELWAMLVGLKVAFEEREYF